MKKFLIYAAMVPLMIGVVAIGIVIATAGLIADEVGKVEV